MQCSVWYSHTVPGQNNIPEQELGVFQLIKHDSLLLIEKENVFHLLKRTTLSLSGHQTFH